MLQQMVFEKLAKAAYARRGSVIPKTHRAASHLFTNLLRTPHGIKLLQVTPEIRQFVAELEEVHPSHIGQQVQPCLQLEYPWEDPITGEVQRVALAEERLTETLAEIERSFSSAFMGTETIPLRSSQCKCQWLGG